ncbi:MAG: NAD(P)-dependent oxidoreductase, partial [Planctomycetota bacterium]
EQEHTVAAFARNPAKLEIEHAHLTVVQGDVLDTASVEKGVDGQDAVLCALGAGAKGAIRTEGTRNIVRAMENAGVNRFICLSTLGVGDSRASLNFFWKHIMFGLLLRGAYADHVSQEDCVKESRLDWTLVRPGAFTDGKRTGVYRHGFPGTDKTIKAKISRADVADFMLKQLTDRTYLHETPGLSY